MSKLTKKTSSKISTSLLPESVKSAEVKEQGKSTQGASSSSMLSQGSETFQTEAVDGEVHEAVTELVPDEDEDAIHLAALEDEDEIVDVSDEGLSDEQVKTKVLGEEASEADDLKTDSLAKLDLMAAYLREIQRHALLTPEETKDLATRYLRTGDPTLAAKLVTSNLRLVVKIAYEYRRAYKNMMDLIQEGNIGLMQAVKRYDPYRGVKLSSYAAWWIRAYILRYILNNWRLVKLGTTQAQRKLFFNLRKKRAELEALGISPTHEEIAKRLGVETTEVAEMDVRLSSSEGSLDAPVGDADGRSVARIDLLAGPGSGPEVDAADVELQEMLKDKLKMFRQTIVGKQKELVIFDERLVAEEPLTLQEIGQRFGISRERVRQLEQRLTLRLRDFLREEMGDATDVSAL